MKRFQNLTLLISAFLISNIYSQNDFIPLSVDYSIFKSGNSRCYLEIYLSIYQNNLSYINYEGKYLAEYVTRAEIFQDDSLLAENIKSSKSTIDSLSQILISRQFIEVFAFELTPGEYQATISLQDINSNKIGEFLFDFEALQFPPDSLTLSDIQIASKISQDNSKSDFTKNSYLVVPNPMGIFTPTLPVVYYYSEIYNLFYEENVPGDYMVNCKIYDKNDHIVKEYPAKLRTKPGKSAVIVGGFNAVSLPTGVYQMELEVLDNQTQKTTQQTKRFTFAKPIRQIAATDVHKDPDVLAATISRYNNFSEEELDREFDYANYIASKDEKKVYESLDAPAKKKFLQRFWNKHDHHPQTPENEFRTGYLERINFANQNFRAMGKDGWQTDRGRVFLVYGSPNEIERHYSEINKKPYEIWYYHELEGGVSFVFGELRGFGEFELIHSTHTKELHKPDWERLLRRTGRGFDAQESEFDSPF